MLIPGKSSTPRGSSDIWIWRAMRSSSSIRFFSAAVNSRFSMLPVIHLDLRQALLEQDRSAALSGGRGGARGAGADDPRVEHVLEPDAGRVVELVHDLVVYRDVDDDGPARPAGADLHDGAHDEV